jgi:chromate transporter
VTEIVGDAGAAPGEATLGQIFRAFLLIGATSFGGGVMAYLRSSLVDKHRWIDDPTFVQMLAMSQSLPGLNSTNMAVLAGDRLRGAVGAAVAICGVCLPGGLIMFIIGMLHGVHGDRPVVTAMLHGVAAAAVGLVMAVAVQIGRKVLTRIDDLGFVALAVIGVNLLRLPVLVVVAVVGAFAIWWHRPRAESRPLQAK